MTKRITYFNNPIVFAGSKIVVTQKEEKEKGDFGKSLEKFASVFTIIASTLTTIILASKL